MREVEVCYSQTKAPGGGMPNEVLVQRLDLFTFQSFIQWANDDLLAAVSKNWDESQADQSFWIALLFEIRRWSACRLCYDLFVASWVQYHR